MAEGWKIKMTKNRKKPEVVVVKDMKGVDACMAELAELNREIENREAEMNTVIDEAKTLYKLKVEPKLARIKVIEAALGAYANLNKQELFKDRKSMDTTFGIIGFRKSTKLLAKGKTKMIEVIETLRNLGLTDGIKVKESVNKEAMREWPDERLEAVGMRRKEEDVFYYEIKRETLED